MSAPRKPPAQRRTEGDGGADNDSGADLSLSTGSESLLQPIPAPAGGFPDAIYYAPAWEAGQPVTVLAQKVGLCLIQSRHHLMGVKIFVQGTVFTEKPVWVPKIRVVFA